MTAAFLLLALLAPALADEGGADAVSLSLGVEARPDTWGEPGWRDAIGVSLASQRGAWGLEAAADFRDGTWVAVHDADALRRLALRWDPRFASVQLGRHLHGDARGDLHLDGLSVSLWPEGLVRPSVWGGRPWRVDTGAPVDVTLAGAELALRPSRTGFGLLPGGAAGVELVADDDSVEPRAYAALGATALRGTSLDLRAEAGALDGAWAARAAGHARVPVSRALDATVDLGWDELPPVESIGQAETPLEWLAPDGVGRAELGVRARGGVQVRAQGGALMRQRGEAEAALGGVGSVGLRLGQEVPLDLSLRGAVIGPSGYGGLVASTGAATRALDWSGGAAIYRLQGLDERQAWVGEVRLMGERALYSGRGASVSMGLGTAAGVDRLLQPWWRGGALLTGRWEGT